MCSRRPELNTIVGTGTSKGTCMQQSVVLVLVCSKGTTLCLKSKLTGPDIFSPFPSLGYTTLTSCFLQPHSVVI